MECPTYTVFADGMETKNGRSLSLVSEDSDCGIRQDLEECIKNSFTSGGATWKPWLIRSIELHSRCQIQACPPKSHWNDRQSQDL